MKNYIYFCSLTPFALDACNIKAARCVSVVLEINYKLRPFKPSDLNAVMRINRECLPENYSNLFFINLYKRFPATFIVAEINGDLVGYIMCRVETGIPSFKVLGITRKGHVISIAVLPGHHRKGIGFSLMRDASHAMSNYNAKEFYLEVRESNLAAINLYKKLGFQVSRTIRNYYADGEDAYVMAKLLASDEQ